MCGGKVGGLNTQTPPGYATYSINVLSTNMGISKIY